LGQHKLARRLWCSALYLLNAHNFIHQSRKSLLHIWRCVKIDHLRTNAYHLVKKSWKPVL